MGEGIFSGMPLQLAGSRQMLERMDWGDYIEKDTFIKFGAVGLEFPFLVKPFFGPC
jgi:adenylate kinase